MGVEPTGKRPKRRVIYPRAESGRGKGENSRLKVIGRKKLCDIFFKVVIFLPLTIYLLMFTRYGNSMKEKNAHI